MGDSFKSGSGDLSFGDSEEEEADNEPEEASEEVGDVANDEVDTQEPEESASDVAEERQDIPGTQGANSEPEENTTTTSTTSGGGTRQTSGHQYPYFVRRSNVGDERGNRLELFARDEVVSRESEFRSRLASELGTNDVAKTDAREYALLAAFDNVEDVAELMKEDGYGELD
jgi:hypothetical protein